MWLNQEQTIDSSIRAHRQSLLHSSPNHNVIDNLFDIVKLDKVIAVLQQTTGWQTQLHTYSALYVDNAEWQNTSKDERFVKRYVWQRDGLNTSYFRLNATDFVPTALIEE